MDETGKAEEGEMTSTAANLKKRPDRVNCATKPWKGPLKQEYILEHALVFGQDEANCELKKGGVMQRRGWELS